MAIKTFAQFLKDALPKLQAADSPLTVLAQQVIDQPTSMEAKEKRRLFADIAQEIGDSA